MHLIRQQKGWRLTMQTGDTSQKEHFVCNMRNVMFTVMSQCQPQVCSKETDYFIQTGATVGKRSNRGTSVYSLITVRWIDPQCHYGHRALTHHDRSSTHLPSTAATASHLLLPRPLGMDMLSVPFRRNITHCPRVSYHDRQTAWFPTQVSACMPVALSVRRMHSPPQVTSVNNPLYLRGRTGTHTASR